MNEKDKGIRCTLAACLEPVGDETYEKLPPHCTIVPPFLVLEEIYSEIVSEFYNIISSWSSYLYDEKATVVRLESKKSIFGTKEEPVIVRRIDPACGEQILNLLALRKILQGSIESLCGQDSTKDWYESDFHVSETEQELPSSEEDISINSLSLFVKQDGKWQQNEVFCWGD